MLFAIVSQAWPLEPLEPLESLPRSHQFPAASKSSELEGTRDGNQIRQWNANMIGVFPEYEWRISTPNQLARRIQKVYNLSLNMLGKHQNKVREAPDVTARPIEPTHPHAYL